MSQNLDHRMKKNKWLLLDRDGVINEESVHRVSSPKVYYPIAGSLEAIANLTQAGFQIVIITNQAGVGRGIFSIETLGKIHAKLFSLVKAAGGEIFDLFFCPHHPDEHCACRKPKPGLIQQFSKKYQVDLQQAAIPFVGDSYRDLQAAKACGCRPFLVKTGFGEKTLQTYSDQIKDVPVFADLSAVAKHLLSGSL